MIFFGSTSSIILFGLLAHTPKVGAAPYDVGDSLSQLENEAASLVQRVWKGISCMGDCRPHWGWTGKHFGSDPWGPVVLVGDPIPYSDSDGSQTGSQSNGSNTSTNAGIGIEDITTTNSDPSSTVAFSVYNVPTLSTTSSSSTSQEPTPTPEPQTTTSSTPEQQPEPTTTEGNQDPPEQNPNPGSNPNPGFGDDQAQYLKQHNDFRAQHGASPLTWSDQLAGFAQQWANNCIFQHSGGIFGRIGENLAAGTGVYNIPEMVSGWTNEISQYDPNNPQASHFTQVVWKATTQIGCAKATCGGIFSEGGSATYYVCEYSPPGNVVGQFGQNVQK